MLWGLIDTARFDPRHWRNLPAVGVSLDGLWLRGPALSPAEWLEWGQAISRLIPQVPLWIGGNVLAARALKADGLQLPSHHLAARRVRDQWDRPIAASVHSLEEYERHREADWFIWGHAYATRSKPGMLPRSRASLEAILKRTAHPVMIIGGVNASTVSEVAHWGGSGVVVGDGIWQQSNPAAAAAVIKDLWNQEARGGTPTDDLDS